MKTTGRVIASMFIILALAISSFTSEAFGRFSPQDEKEETTTLYIVDGEQMSSKDVDKLNYADIEKMEYVKEKAEIKKYTDDKTVTMVVLLTMKKDSDSAKEKK